MDTRAREGGYGTTHDVQYPTEGDLRQAVEEITGRRVVSFMSGIDIHHALACETFTLEPHAAT
jgi:uncharacterized protein YbcI